MIDLDISATAGPLHRFAAATLSKQKANLVTYQFGNLTHLWFKKNKQDKKSQKLWSILGLTKDPKSSSTKIETSKNAPSP